jgi:glycolate oxidase FAD binding subunit
MAAVCPVSVAGLADILRSANDEGRKVHLGRESSGSPRDVTLSLEHLDLPVEHCAGDLIATVPAGATLAAVNDILGRNGQWLPLDPPDAARATIGAIVATNDSGPRRHRFGAPRDLIIGVEMVLADGRIAKGGGRVVKNVAGYDVPRLMCGSRGCLAIVTSATFKLSPLPLASRTVVVQPGDLQSLGTLARSIADEPLTPSAIELDSPPHRLLVRFESTKDAVAAQAAALAALCLRQGVSATVVGEAEESVLWTSHEEHVSRANGTLLKISVLPTDVSTVLGALEHSASAHRVEWHAAGRAALGVLDVRLSKSADHHAAVVSDLRGAIARGSVVAIEADSSPTFDRWGPMGDAWPLMRAMKNRFDPRNTLNPGKGPGGL